MSLVREKKCVKCDTVKPIDEFPYRPQLKSGRSNYCKDCMNASSLKSKRKVKLMKEAREKQARSMEARGMDYWDAAPDVPEILPKLSPCPFCGKVPKFSRFVVGRTSVWDIVCACTESRKHYVVYSFDTPDDAASWWNRRKSDKESVA